MPSLLITPVPLSTEVDAAQICPQGPRSPRFGPPSPAGDAHVLSTSSTASSAGGSPGEALPLTSKALCGLAGRPPYPAIGKGEETYASGEDDEADRSYGDMSSGILSQFAFSGDSLRSLGSDACDGEEWADPDTSEEPPEVTPTMGSCEVSKPGQEAAAVRIQSAWRGGRGRKAGCQAPKKEKALATLHAAPDCGVESVAVPGCSRKASLVQPINTEDTPGSVGLARMNQQLSPPSPADSATFEPSSRTSSGLRSPTLEWGTRLSSIEEKMQRSMDAQAVAVLNMQERLEGIVQRGLEEQAKVVSNMKAELERSCRDDLLNVCSNLVREQVEKQSQDLLAVVRQKLEDQVTQFSATQQRIEDGVNLRICKALDDLKQELNDRFQVVEGELHDGMVAQATESLGTRRELEACQAQLKVNTECQAQLQAQASSLQHGSGVGAAEEKLEGPRSDKSDAHAVTTGELSAAHARLQEEMRSCSSLCEAAAASAAASHAKLKDEVNRRFEAHSSAASVRSEQSCLKLENQMALASASHGKLEQEVSKRLESHLESATAASVSSEEARQLSVAQTRLQEEMRSCSSFCEASAASAAEAHAKLKDEMNRRFEAHSAAASVRSEQSCQKLEDQMALAAAAQSKVEEEVRRRLEAHVAMASAETSASQAKLQEEVARRLLEVTEKTSQRLETASAEASALQVKWQEEVARRLEVTEKTSKSLEMEFATAAASQAQLEDDVSKRFEADASNLSMRSQEVRQQFEEAFAKASEDHASLEKEVSKKIDLHSEAVSAASVRLQETTHRLEECLSVSQAAHDSLQESVSKRFDSCSTSLSSLEESVNRRIDGCSTSLSTASMLSEEANQRLLKQMDAVSVAHASLADEMRQRFAAHSAEASAMQAQVHDALQRKLESQSSAASLLHIQLTSELERIDSGLQTHAARVQTLEDDTCAVLRDHVVKMYQQVDDAKQDQAAVLGDVLRKTQAAELQRDADYACLESEMQTARQQCEKGLVRAQESLQVHENCVQDLCRRTEQASECKSAEALRWLKTYAEAHEADRVGAWERIEQEVVEDSQEMQAQGRKLRGDIHRKCEEQGEALREMHRRVEGSLQELQTEFSAVSKQRVAEMAEAQRAEDAALCQAAGVHVMSELHDALQAQCAVLRNMRRRELLGGNAQLSTVTEWRELIDDVRQVMASRYMESLEVCKCAEDSLSACPQEAAAMLVAKVGAGRAVAAQGSVVSFQANSAEHPSRALAEDQSFGHEIKSFLSSTHPVAPSGKRPASARPAPRAAHMPPFSMSLHSAAKYPGRLKGAVKGSQEQASY